jgi:hydroxyacylglutathione hydrolase
VDPGGVFQQIVDFIENSESKLIAILGTHAHYDHIGEVSRLKEHFSVPYYLHSKDKKLLRRANLYCKMFEGDHPIPIPTVDGYFDELERVILYGSFSIEVRCTPGHTPGSVSFYIDGHLFVGDILFHNRIGRTDLPGGDPKALHKSLKQLSTLPHGTIVWPGHGSVTTIGDLFANNSDLLKKIKNPRSKLRGI